MKKALSLLLAILLVTVGVVPAMATETDEIHEIFSVSDTELFADTFGMAAATYVTNSVANNGVIYDYNVTLEEDGTYNAFMEFDVVINGTAHRATALGTLNEVVLENGSTYLSGPLDGSIEVGNNEYKIIVGFQTEYGSDEISAGITLENEAVLHFAFGDYEMPDEIYETHWIESGNSVISRSQVDLSNSKSTTLRSVGTYTVVGSDAVKASNISSNVSFFTAYYNTYPDYLYVEITADSSPLLTDAFYSTSRVYSTTTTLEATDSSTYPSIYRFVHYPGDDVGDTVGTYIRDVFELIDSFAGIPIPLTSILDLYESTTGPVSSTNSNTIRTKFTLTTKPAHGDYGQGNTPPLPILWELHTAVTGSYEYTVTSNVRFVCTNIKQIYYVNAYTASDSFYVHVNA